MDAFFEFTSSTPFFVIMGILLLALIAFLIYRLVFAGKGED